MRQGRKIYYTFEKLADIIGPHKPYGTMGKHHFVTTPENGTVTVRGSVAGEVTISPGETMGYQVGNVWKVPAPSSYKDPIRRTLAELHLPQKLLKYSDEPVTFFVTYEPISPLEDSCADTNIGQDCYVLGEYGRKGEVWDDYSTRVTVTGGDVVLVMSIVGRETTTRRPRRITDVIVRPGADPDKVTEFIRDPYDTGRRV